MTKSQKPTRVNFIPPFKINEPSSADDALKSFQQSFWKGGCTVNVG